MKSADKHRKIIRAAIKVFAKKGFFNARISDIAKEAKVADGTIYLYFNNKFDILLSVFEQEIGKLIEQVVLLLDKEENPRRKLEIFIANHLEEMKRNKYLAEVIHIELRQTSKLIREYRKNKFSEYLDIIATIIDTGQQAGIFRPDIQPEIAKQLIFGALDEVSRICNIGKDHPYTIEEVSRQLTATFLEGMLAPQSGVSPARFPTFPPYPAGSKPDRQRPPARAVAILLVDLRRGDEHHLEFADTAGGLGDHLVTDLFAEQGPAKGREYGNRPLLHIRLFRAEQLIGDLSLGGQVEQGDHRAEHRPLDGHLGAVDDLGPTELVLEFQDTALDQALPFLGSVIFGVLAEIAVCPGHLDRLDNFVPLHALEPFEFVAELLMTRQRHRDALNHLQSSCCAGAAVTVAACGC